MKFFSEGKLVEYTGGRTAKDIVAWIQKRTGLATTPLKTVAEYEALIA